VQTLKRPTPEEFLNVVNSWQPNLVYFRGDDSQNDGVRSFICGLLDMSSHEDTSELFNRPVSTSVYLELSSGQSLAEQLLSKGISYVIYWKNSVPYQASRFFRQTLLLVLQSSSCHPWDAFQLAEASFRLHCLRNNVTIPECENPDEDLGPKFIGEPPQISVECPETEDPWGGDGESSSGSLPAIKIYDDDVNLRFLVCGVASSL
ncbi:hypothetical protein M569_08858, partial [Genlisea aurea]